MSAQRPQTPTVDSILGVDQEPRMVPDAGEKPRRHNHGQWKEVAKGRVAPIGEVVSDAATAGANMAEKAGKLAGAFAGLVEATTGKTEHGDVMRAAAKIGSMAPAVVAGVKEQLKPVGEAMREFADAAGKSGIKPTMREPYHPNFAKRRPVHVGSGPKKKESATEKGAPQSPPPQGRGTVAVDPKKEEGGR